LRWLIDDGDEGFRPQAASFKLQAVVYKLQAEGFNDIIEKTAGLTPNC
jgi:hypothetical protein